MDTQRFDEWTQSLTRRRSRRATMRLLAGVVIGGLPAWHGPAGAARCRLVTQTCGRRRRCCAGAHCPRRGRCRCRAGFTRCDDGRCRACADGEVCIVGCCRPNNAPCSDVCTPGTACAACCLGLCDAIGTCQTA